MLFLSSAFDSTWRTLADMPMFEFEDIYSVAVVFRLSVFAAMKLNIHSRVFFSFLFCFSFNLVVVTIRCAYTPVRQTVSALDNLYTLYTWRCPILRQRVGAFEIREFAIDLPGVIPPVLETTSLVTCLNLLKWVRFPALTYNRLIKMSFWKLCGLPLITNTLSFRKHARETSCTLGRAASESLLITLLYFHQYLIRPLRNELFVLVLKFMYSS